MISKLDKVMDNLEKEKKLQTETTQEPTKEELVRIDEVMNAVHKVIHQLFRLIRLFCASFSFVLFVWPFL